MSVFLYSPPNYKKKIPPPGTQLRRQPRGGDTYRVQVLRLGLVVKCLVSPLSSFGSGTLTVVLTLNVYYIFPRRSEWRGALVRCRCGGVQNCGEDARRARDRHRRCRGGCAAGPSHVRAVSSAGVGPAALCRPAGTARVRPGPGAGAGRAGRGGRTLVVGGGLLLGGGDPDDVAAGGRGGRPAPTARPPTDARRSTAAGSRRGAGGACLCMVYLLATCYLLLVLTHNTYILYRRSVPGGLCAVSETRAPPPRRHPHTRRTGHQHRRRPPGNYTRGTIFHFHTTFFILNTFARKN